MFIIFMTLNEKDVKNDLGHEFLLCLLYCRILRHHCRYKWQLDTGVQHELQCTVIHEYLMIKCINPIYIHQGTCSGSVNFTDTNLSLVLSDCTMLLFISGPLFNAVACLRGVVMSSCCYTSAIKMWWKEAQMECIRHCFKYLFYSWS